MESYPVVSADGRWLAYLSDESGTREVYVRRADGTGGREPVSNGAAQEIIWSKVGSELFYRGADGLYSATITKQNGIQVVRRHLFDDSELSRTFVGYASDISYDIDPTGEHFVMIWSRGEGDARLHVVLNFAEELKAKVGN